MEISAEILDKLNKIGDSIDNLKDRMDDLEISYGLIATRLDAYDNNDKVQSFDDWMRTEDYTTDKKLDEMEKAEVSEYLVKHYMQDCDLSEQLTVAQFKQLGFDFSEEEINDAMLKYKETPEL